VIGLLDGQRQVARGRAGVHGGRPTARPGPRLGRSPAVSAAPKPSGWTHPACSTCGCKGLARATQYGYSIYELQAYPLA